ncbi:hypothetical protein [Pseudalkalibacillus caeni]|uniref:Uncharacterized protein n=1 Tax=Exobacillus caeni TaxID=2574798 RepID=A0A5R9F6X2_9BACL|nr:hypothetical protein [Pseudalkalibacillus caeni]TLS38781.1 hypothetical protein FCL54_00225 [Pseudalkalibacillus caeni]
MLFPQESTALRCANEEAQREPAESVMYFRIGLPSVMSKFIAFLQKQQSSRKEFNKKKAGLSGLTVPNSRIQHQVANRLLELDRTLILANPL